MTVLIIVHSATWFTELSVLGRYIHGLRNHTVVFHFIDYGHASMREFAADLRREGIRCVLECEQGPPRKFGRKAAAAPLPSSAVSTRDRVVRGAIRKLRAFGAVEARDFLVHMLELSGAIADARALGRIYAPDVVILGGNNPGYTTPALIEGFKRAGAPTVIVSSTMSNGLEEAAVYAGDPRSNVTHWPARLAAAAFPKWCIEYGGARGFRCHRAGVLPPGGIGGAPPPPWGFYKGYSPTIAPGRARMNHYYVWGRPPPDGLSLS